VLVLLGAVALTIVLAAAAATFVVEHAQEQDEQHEIRTQLADDMSASLADAVGTARLAARGDVQEPVQRRALVAWTAAAGRIEAELAGRFPGADVLRQWRGYGRAVDAYLRLGGPTNERESLLGYLSSYGRAAGVVWGHLAPPSGLTTGSEFQTAYAQVGTWLLRRGGELVRLVLSLDPNV
jgi:hypothetical protein